MKFAHFRCHERTWRRGSTFISFGNLKLNRGYPTPYAWRCAGTTRVANSCKVESIGCKGPLARPVLAYQSSRQITLVPRDFLESTQKITAICVVRF